MRVPDIDGLLVLDKPGGLTSRDAVDRALRWFPRGTRMGHTGTLDPLATGVLVLCLGKATRLVEYVQDMGKTYQSRFLLGARSETDDADGSVAPVVGAVPPDEATLAGGLARFVGTIEQVPPAYSAAKVTGRRAYDLARQGGAVVLRPRPVRVYGIDVLHYAYPHLDVEVRCGKGTYIRSLARDLGEVLGCGAMVETLRRTRVGPFCAEDAVSVEAEPAAARARLLPLGWAVTELPRIELPRREVERLRRGQAVPLPPGVAAEETEVAVFDGERLAAVARVDAARRAVRPVKVFAEGE
jgi:tRNA pseudouridine55 synthase